MPTTRPRPPPPSLAPPSLEESFVDAIVGGLEPGWIERARARFEERTGRFDASDPFHEERMRALSDELVCDQRLPDGRTPAERAAERLLSDGDPEARRWTLALTRSERGLFRAEHVASEVRLRCLLGGALFRVALDGGPTSPARRLRPGDLFDGRLVPLGSSIRVLAGMIFHPEQAHPSILALVPRALERGVGRGDLLDGLLRMRMRHDRFTSMHARHVYRLDALETREIQSAAWTTSRAPR